MDRKSRRKKKEGGSFFKLEGVKSRGVQVGEVTMGCADGWPGWVGGWMVLVGGVERGWGSRITGGEALVVSSPVARIGERVGSRQFILDGTLDEAVSCCWWRPSFGAYSVPQVRSTGENKKITNRRQEQRGNWVGLIS